MSEDQEILESPAEKEELTVSAQSNVPDQNDEALTQETEAAEQNDASPEQSSSKKTKRKFRFTKRFVVGAIVLTVVVTLIVIAAFLFANRDRRPNYALYVKNGALYYTDFKGSTFRVTSNLTATDNMLPNVEYDLRYCAYLSDNGDYLFFPENMTISGDDVQTFDLCYQNVSKEERETVRISENVIEYYVSSDAMTITYRTTDGLYQYELKPATANLLCKNVTEFQMSEKSGKLIYRTADGALYAQNPDSAKSKIDNHVDQILWVAEDFRSVIYLQETSIHRWVYGKGETEICDDAVQWHVFSSGKALFLSNAEGYAQLLYHSGQDTSIVAEHVDELIWVAGDAPVALLTAARWEEAEEISEEETAEPVKYIDTILVSEKDVYILEDMENKTCVGIDGNGKHIYFVDKQMQYGTLYVLPMGTFGVEDMQIFDTDVYNKNITVTNNNRVVYFKDVNEETNCGTLFLNTAELGSNVPMALPDTHYQPFAELPESNHIYYFTDFDPEKGSGTLHVAGTDGTNRQISGTPAVRPFMLHNGQILFMENYSEHTGGDLYVYMDGSIILIDSGVTFYIPVL